MPSGDEGTGLHAFDDLDPVSTVSALNSMPELDGPSEGSGSVPRSLPPPPPRRLGTLPMAPLPRGGSGRSLPPPPPQPQSAYSSPPPPPPVSFQDASDDLDAEADADSDDDTRVVPTADYADYAQGAAAAAASVSADADAFEDLDNSVATGLAPLPGQTPGAGDSDLLELSASTVATNIDMDWDEEDVQTKLRDENDPDLLPGMHGASSPLVAGRPSPFPGSLPGSYPGNPSPFGQGAPSVFPATSEPQGGEWESEEEALTRVMSVHPMPVAAPDTLPPNWRGPGTDSLAPASNAPTLLGTERPALNARLAWLGLGAVALIGAAFGTRALLMSDEPATVTIVTKPSDAEVLVDGRPLAGGQSSPFTVQGLAPEQAHMIVVRKPGYTEQTHHFELEAGETRALPPVELSPIRVDTGFALESVPAGAEIYVDDRKLDSVTPARITDLDPGLHVIRLVRGEGYQPWETQVALASGQVIELPTARLVAASGRAARASADRDDPPAARRASSSSSRTRSARSGARRERPAPAARVEASSPARASGAGGTLRINSRPWSQVYVDGRLIGNTPQLNIPLSSGSHSIKLVNPQLGMTKNLKVRIQAGQMTTKIVELME